MLCVVDDAHRLDDASARALLFVARRLQAERVALIIAARDGDVHGFDAPGLAELTLAGLTPAAAAQRLAESAGPGVTPQVCEWLTERTGGNPLALLELPPALSAAQLAGQEPLPASLPLTQGVERAFLDRVNRLSPAVRSLLTVAAADDTGRLATVRAAAGALGIDPGSLDEAERSGLLRVRGADVEFRHPLVRSAVYAGVTTRARQDAHAALARVLEEAGDADRHAWHRAAATVEPDEAVARALEAAAGRAAARGATGTPCWTVTRRNGTSSRHWSTTPRGDGRSNAAEPRWRTANSCAGAGAGSTPGLTCACTCSGPRPTLSSMPANRSRQEA